MRQENTPPSTLSKRWFPITAVFLFAFGALTPVIGLTTYDGPIDPADEPRTLWRMTPFTIPLNNTTPPKEMNMELGLVIRSSQVDRLHDIGVSTALRSGIISYAEKVRPSQLEAEGGKEAFKSELLNRINELLRPTEIDDLEISSLTL